MCKVVEVGGTRGIIIIITGKRKEEWAPTFRIGGEGGEGAGESLPFSAPTTSKHKLTLYIFIYCAIFY